jgi:hypothetical protein
MSFEDICGFPLMKIMKTSMTSSLQPVDALKNGKNKIISEFSGRFFGWDHFPMSPCPYKMDSNSPNLLGKI